MFSAMSVAALFDMLGSTYVRSCCFLGVREEARYFAA